ncbi:phosphatidylserine decarboxylase [Sphingomonas adhaesiva]|uniref:phosphatidylserine decarboxylase n=1 Tax=Sphingomonas adhaesiva TaxID=28212 RepID=UPI002FF92914
MRGAFLRLLMQEDLNFLLTNRLPRRWATQMVGRIAASEHPLVARPALAAWRFFGDVDLSEAETTHFRSLREGFVRRLRAGARRFEGGAGAICAPCDAIVGAHGGIDGTAVWQVKGFPYRLEELVPDAALVERFRDGRFVTLRLTAAMYHRFHAPADLTVEGVTYLSGDCWNVNPIALRRVERLFCRNERAVIEARLADGTPDAAGAGRRDPGGEHPAGVPGYRAVAARAGQRPRGVRRGGGARHGDGVVRARLDDPDVPARRGATGSGLARGAGDPGGGGGGASAGCGVAAEVAGASAKFLPCSCAGRSQGQAQQRLMGRATLGSCLRGSTI